MRYFKFPADSMSRATSSRLSTTGSLCSTRTERILVPNSGRPTVGSKKNFSAVMVALIEIGDMPTSTRCN